jgi:hypothetical protein
MSFKECDNIEKRLREDLEYFFILSEIKEIEFTTIEFSNNDYPINYYSIVIAVFCIMRFGKVSKIKLAIFENLCVDKFNSEQIFYLDLYNVYIALLTYIPLIKPAELEILLNANNYNLIENFSYNTILLSDFIKMFNTEEIPNLLKLYTQQDIRNIRVFISAEVNYQNIINSLKFNNTVEILYL